jgi:GTP pyrophosphokinase
MVETMKKPLQYMVCKLFEIKSSSVIKYVDFHFQWKKRNTWEDLLQHSLRMFKNCISSWIYDETILHSILLHDIIEDADVDRLEIYNEYGPYIAWLVDAMTCVNENGLKYNKEQYFWYFEQQCDKEWRLLFIKLFDCIDNLQTLDGFNEERKARFILEKREVYFPIFEKYIWSIPYEYRLIYMKKIETLKWLLS